MCEHAYECGREKKHERDTAFKDDLCHYANKWCSWSQTKTFSALQNNKTYLINFYACFLFQSFKEKCLLLRFWDPQLWRKLCSISFNEHYAMMASFFGCCKNAQSAALSYLLICGIMDWIQAKNIYKILQRKLFLQEKWLPVNFLPWLCGCEILLETRDLGSNISW